MSSLVWRPSSAFKPDYSLSMCRESCPAGFPDDLGELGPRFGSGQRWNAGVGRGDVTGSRNDVSGIDCRNGGATSSFYYKAE